MAGPLGHMIQLVRHIVVVAGGITFGTSLLRHGGFNMAASTIQNVKIELMEIYRLFLQGFRAFFLRRKKKEIFSKKSPKLL